MARVIFGQYALPSTWRFVIFQQTWALLPPPSLHRCCLLQWLPSAAEYSQLPVRSDFDNAADDAVCDLSLWEKFSSATPAPQGLQSMSAVFNFTFRHHVAPGRQGWKISHFKLILQPWSFNLKGTSVRFFSPVRSQVTCGSSQSISPTTTLQLLVVFTVIRPCTHSLSGMQCWRLLRLSSPWPASAKECCVTCWWVLHQRTQTFIGMCEAWMAGWIEGWCNYQRA